MSILQPEVCIGCGLNVLDDGTLIVRTGGTNWPFDCAESNGAPIYCGNDGIIRTRPVPRHVVVSETMDAPANRLLNGGETPDLVACIDNPSPCLSAVVTVFGWVSARYQVTPGNRWELAVRTFCVGCDDPLINPFGAGRGAPGGGFARALITDGPVGRNQMLTSAGENAGRSPTISTPGPVQRVSAGAAPNDADNLVQSDAAVSVQEGTVHTDGAVGVRPGAIWSESEVRTEQVMIGPAVDDQEAGLVQGASRPRRFTVDPGDQFCMRMRIMGRDGAEGDTFSDANLSLMLMLTTQSGV